MIKILIVDDNIHKQNNIKNAILENHSINSKFIYVSNSVKEAEKLIRKEYFDLMILDLVLPIEINGECTPENGINFLHKIQISPYINPPIHIVGMSGFKDKVLEFNNQFKMKLWNLIEYSENSSNWHSQLESIIFHLVKTRQQFLSSSLEDKLHILHSELEDKNYPYSYLGYDWLSISKNLVEIVERSLEIPSKFSNGGKAKNINEKTLIISSEYDFQNLIHTVLRPWLPSTEAENIAIKYDGNTKYADFSINGNSIIIEVKYIDSTGKKNDTLKTLEGLKYFYKQNANIKSLIFLLLVEDKVKIDKYKLENEFNSLHKEPIVLIKVLRNRLKK